ncbi:MAG: histone deacetylase [Ignavibacteriales bacterium]|nr:MAG: histone deacetylase [Ignavibacteriales bacterium]
MKIFYSDHYTIPLPEGHRFPMEKYRLLREGLVEAGVLQLSELHQTRIASEDEVASVHSPAYIKSVSNGTLTPMQIRKIGFPWSPELAVRSFATVGGAISAAFEALKTGISGNLAGGTHHAFRESGEGFCVFNDQAVAAQLILSQKLVKKVLIVDLDVHQGNGTSDIFSDSEDVFVFSMHGEKNYPFKKVNSHLDIPLIDNMEDDEYLGILGKHLPSLFDQNPDIVLYQAGVDPLREDRLGRLDLSFAGLKERDRMVLSECKKRGIPVSLAMGGGYAVPISLTVEAHINTYRVVKELYK